MVAMHWGTENLTEADAEQTRLAQFLADWTLTWCWDPTLTS